MAKSSLEKQKIAQKLAEFNAYLQPHVVADNQQFGRLSAEIFPWLEAATQNLPQLLTEQAQHLRNVRKRAYWESLNSRARQDIDLLFALPLPNGGYPAEGEFPETLGESMSLEGPALKALLKLYEVPHQDQVTDPRSTLARYFSIPM
ncbi:unnamed protein product [Rhizoctonia solani]|uniref:Uncharacterized protein n=1 Tax=Rhizoctonia solani TaxID=456999 RepID=A0A8H3BNG0_9AGAM|nr:unnamed protein product [Rhizoctonia solani]